MVTAKKKLYKAQNHSEVICTAASVHVDADVSVKEMISQLNTTMQTFFASLSDKMNEMEKNMERKLINKFNQQIDKRVNSENTKLRKEIESQMSNLRTDLCDDIAELNAKLNSLSENVQNNQVNDYASSDGQFQSMEKNIIIRNLPYGQNENMSGIVDGLFRDGLRIVDVVVDHVERKESRSESVPGVVVVTLASKEEKRKILKVKAHLVKSQQYKHVYIHPDLPKRERQLAANFRKVVNAVQNSDVKLFVKGSRVISSKRSLSDELFPTQDRSHYGEGDLRVNRVQSYERYEPEDMDTCNSYSDKHYNTDKQCFSVLRSNTKDKRRSQNSQNDDSAGKDMPSTGGRSSINGRSSSGGRPPFGQWGSSTRSRPSGNRFVEVNRHSTAGGRSDCIDSNRYWSNRDQQYHGNQRRNYDDRGRSYSK